MALGAPEWPRGPAVSRGSGLGHGGWSHTWCRGKQAAPGGLHGAAPHVQPTGLTDALSGRRETPEDVRDTEAKAPSLEAPDPAQPLAGHRR